MIPLRRALAVGLVGAAAALSTGGCGQEVELASDDQLRRGADLFAARCGGCHTLDAAGAQGSKPARKIANSERTNGPNFNTRPEEASDVLYAIRNGGFSGAIMPANIVVGRDAQDVANFLAEYAGKKESRDAE